MNRLFGLDSLRGVAAISVVIYHYTYRYNEIYGHQYVFSDWFYFGKFGVQLFFIISGYVIYLTVSKIDKPIDFIFSRFTRLYPVYWFAVFVTFIAVSLFGLTGREVSVFDACLNFFMFHDYFRIPSVDGVYWTLSVELTFYFWVFFVLMLKQSHNLDCWLFLVVILYFTNDLGFVNVNGYVSKLLFVNYCAYFVVGICIYKVTNNLNFYRALLILFLTIFIMVNSSKGIDWLFLVVFPLVVFFAVSNNKIFLNPLLIYLGGISYSLYLIHQNIGYIIINYSYAHGLGMWAGVSLAILVSILIAHFLTVFVEQPSSIYLRSYYRKIKVERVRNKIRG